jgi:hypothetical protein
VLTPFEDYLACFTTNRSQNRYSGVLKDSANGPAGLARSFAVEERKGKVFLSDTARKAALPNKTTDLEGKVVELRERVVSIHVGLG